MHQGRFSLNLLTEATNNSGESNLKGPIAFLKEHAGAMGFGQDLLVWQKLEEHE
jgi:hypothetical protein